MGWPGPPPLPPPEVVRVLAVVDRGQGATQIFQQRGYPFTTLFSIADLLPVERG